MDRSIRRRQLLLGFCLGLTMPLSALALEGRVDPCIPHQFTSSDNGKTRCFGDNDCQGPPPGGWPWEAEDVAKFDVSKLSPPFDPKRPQPYRSSDGGQSRCFIGYCCQGPPSGGWTWTDSGESVAQAWYQKPWLWIRATFEAFKEVIPDLPDIFSTRPSAPITVSTQLASMSEDVADVAITVAQLLKTADRGTKEVMNDLISHECPGRICSKEALWRLADDLSEESLTGIGNISRMVSALRMNPTKDQSYNAQYRSYVRSFVGEWAKQTGYTVN